MKKYLIVSLLLLSSFAFSQISGDAYYRIQNDTTLRYVRMIDNKGKINIQTTSADLGALETVRPFSKVVSDPSAIMYINNIGGIDYNIACQGTSLVDMMGFGIKISPVKNKPNVYRAYQESNGIRQYINDEISSDDYGVVLSNDKNARDWRVIPVDVNSTDAYFGVAPELNSNGKYYSSFYAGFSFSIFSPDMRAYYVSYIYSKMGVCVIDELTGIIPSSTPLIVECSSNLPENNKLDLVKVNTSSPGNNLLKGVFFNNPNKLHYNRVAYNSFTMRLLGITKSGKLGFIKSTLDFIPANGMYLSVPVDTPDELTIVTQDEYQFLLMGVDDIFMDEESSDSYSINGIKINNLLIEKRGIYIKNGKKYISK